MVLQFKLNDKERDKLAAISPDDSVARTALQTQQCESITLFAKAHFILYIPGLSRHAKSNCPSQSAVAFYYDSASMASHSAYRRSISSFFA